MMIGCYYDVSLLCVDDQANWYVQDTSSEESEEEPYVKPQMAEEAIEAVDDEMPGVWVTTLH